MNATSLLPALACMLLALLTASVLAKRDGLTLRDSPFPAIDGARGYLAMLVFLHHASIWYFYARSGRWELPASASQIQFGQGRVALFFMVTSFIFSHKLLEVRQRQRPVDWLQLLVARVMRLAPLYFVVVALMLVVVAILSDGVLHEPLPVLFKKIARWAGFTVFGSPDLNGVAGTRAILAGVTWPLPYELFFYAVLPLLAGAIGVRTPPLVLALSAAMLIGIVALHPHLWTILPFASGVAAALLVRIGALRRRLTGPLAGLACIACIGLVFAHFGTPNAPLPLLLLSLAFLIVACGNSLFGLLQMRLARVLGERAYSLYLLHGLLLFVLFTFVIGPERTSRLGLVEHWSLIAALTPALVWLSHLSHRWIESPAIGRSRPLLHWLRFRFDRSLTRRPAGAAHAGASIG